MKIFHESKLRTSQSHDIYIYIKVKYMRKKYERVIKSDATLLPFYKIIIIKLMQFSFLIYFANYN